VRVASDGIWLFCGTTRGAGIWCAMTGLDYEPELRQILALLKPGQVFLDIGANIGTYSIRAAKRVGPEGRVFSFEPLDINKLKLDAAIKANNITNIVVMQAAVGDRDGVVTIHDGGRESSASVFHSTGRAFDTRMMSVDRFVAESGIQQLDWIKMDIEGYEPVALAGMQQVLKVFRPHFLFENHEGGSETCCILHASGYRIGPFSHCNKWRDSTSDENLFAIPAEKLSKFVPTDPHAISPR
jgi:FkbM family methyltransferase